jgi:hypothetical protein
MRLYCLIKNNDRRGYFGTHHIIYSYRKCLVTRTKCTLCYLIHQSYRDREDIGSYTCAAVVSPCIMYRSELISERFFIKNSLKILEKSLYHFSCLYIREFLNLIRTESIRPWIYTERCIYCTDIWISILCIIGLERLRDICEKVFSIAIIGDIFSVLHRESILESCTSISTLGLIFPIIVEYLWGYIVRGKFTTLRIEIMSLVKKSSNFLDIRIS